MRKEKYGQESDYSRDSASSLFAVAIRRAAPSRREHPLPPRFPRRCTAHDNGAIPCLSPYLKKSQISIVLIIGVVLLLGAIALFTALSGTAKDKLASDLGKGGTASEDKAIITNYVEGCIREGSLPVIKEFAQRGGSLLSSPVSFRGKQVAPYAQYGKGGYDALIKTRQDMEQELGGAVLPAVLHCIDEGIWTEQGFSTTKGEPSAIVQIGVKDVTVRLSYPLTLEKPAYTLKFTDFSAVLEFPLENLRRTAIDIVNKDIQGAFDKEGYMLSHPGITIEKFTPYPHTVFRVSLFDPRTQKEDVFQAAIQGRETAGKEAYSLGKSGCCTTPEGVCHKNAAEAACAALEGMYQQSPACACPENRAVTGEGCCKTAGGCSIVSRESCGGEFFDGDVSCSQTICPSEGCARTYSYATNNFTSGPRKSGESWCGYESITGFGRDYVGTRQYLHSCVDGREYVTPCRDYREEICVSGSGSVSGTAKAKCRVNRWEDCAEQGTKQACEDTSQRDCYWSGFLFFDKKCHPAVPPGFKFWEGTGEPVCNRGNIQKNEEGQWLPQSWGDAAALYCLRLGDCGNSRNYVDKISELGYWNPEIVVDQWVYGDAGYDKKGNQFTLPLPADASQIISAPIPQGLSGGSAQCSVWRPERGDCKSCGASAAYPCTEYKCRSLGSNCRFDPATGCSSMEFGGDSAPAIINFSVDKYLVKEKRAGDKITQEILSPVPAYSPVTFSFATSERTRCHLSAFPPFFPPSARSAMPFFLPDISLNGEGYQSSYNGTLRFPPLSFLGMGGVEVYIICMDQRGIDMDKQYAMAIQLRNEEQHPPEIVSAQVEPVSGGLLLNFYTDRPFSSCRYGGEGQAFAEMGNLSCAAEETDILYLPGHIGVFACRETIPNTAQKVYVSCEGQNGASAPIPVGFK